MVKSTIGFIGVGIFIVGVASFDLSRLNTDKFDVPLQSNLDSIVGGHPVTIEEYPHQVALHLKRFHCGGFIISENYILTAGHCTKGIPAAKFKVRVGSTFRNNGTLVSIAEVITHPEFVKADKDIAVFKTAKPIQFSESVKAVQLPPKGRPVEKGSMINVSGWGHMSEHGYPSEKLLAVEVPVVDFQECKKIYQELGATITENMFCAGIVKGGKDSCQGDSGGAAMQGNMAVGIVSFGRGCARPGIPGVYTDIAAPAVRDFITKHTGL